MKLNDVFLIPSRAQFVRKCVETGNFESENEVIHEALGILELCLENDEVRLCVLRAELQKGLDDYEAGRYICFESREEREKYFEDRRQRLMEQYAAEQNAAAGPQD